MSSTVIDHEGKLAIQIGGGWQTRQDEPVEDKLLSVSDIDAARYRHLMGCRVDFTGHDGVIRPVDYGPTWINTETWERVVLERPIKKPRRGKDYDWEWKWGQWRKVWR